MHNLFLFFLAGMFSGFVNSMASSGSAFTLPLFPLLGLSPSLGNGTNRISILVSSFIATTIFARAGKIDWRNAIKIAIPTVIGAIIGAKYATTLNPKAIAWVIIVAVLIAIFMMLFNPQRMLINETRLTKKLAWYEYFIFALIGFWTGFIVLDSATWMLLALTLVCGYDLIHANGIKNFLLLVCGLTSVFIFGFSNEINWTIGLSMAAGGVIGSIVGSKLGIKEEFRKWTFRILIFALISEVTIMSLRIIFIK